MRALSPELHGLVIQSNGNINQTVIIHSVSHLLSELVGPSMQKQSMENTAA